ncbi:DUF3870 domain-containing protein [Fusibacter sp. JL216-2]|uniref:DUF3870 domain-containing protein n=1 Tax=Fusibacter sp. JL216-2 TaxID=3071453 RepID=UPI003D353F3C
MKHYDSETVYFISYAKLPSNMAAGQLVEVVGVGLVINYKTGRVTDMSCTLITDEAKMFLKDIIVGFNLHEDSVQDLIDAISFRYHGHSQKAICVAVKQSIERYHQWRSEKMNKS